MHTTPGTPERAPGVRTRWLLLCLCLIASTFGTGTVSTAAATKPSARQCDEVPTGVDTRNHWLMFRVPRGLMPDPRFDGRPARIQVHRVRPVYANGKCPGVTNRAAVLIHGRTETASPTFDLRHPAPEGGQLSTQEALARAGIDTFAPSLLGYGRSTRFDEGLNDPGNASLRPYNADGSCSHPEGCDRTHNPAAFALDQQGALLLTNPLAGQRRPHSSQHRFARVDTFVRDIRQTIDDAITRAQPTDGKVTLVGYSLGAQHVGRTLYAANPVLPGSAAVIAKVNRAVFLAPFFGGPTEETTPPAGFVTYPLNVAPRQPPSMLPPDREAACTGRIIPGSLDQIWEQIMEQDTEGRNWGGDDPGNPTGINRSPTFSSYGWNAAVAGQLTPPTLVMQGIEDRGVPGGAANAPAVYNALPAAMTNKLLVQVQCAAHQLHNEGCTGPRCTPESGTPYGGRPGEPWAGPHSTTKAALIEWVKSGTFNGAASGRFTVDESGVAAPTT
ncbi:alpha/beta hydrolase [Streptomyces sp. NBC_01381]|uniref:alpha/beta fold hydrolase n=1 Tax=Streptomyces sp. NBC_01381 TaxID=2903845 RepID=UPI00224DF27C|nr:alpha/beta fold hydrolase [Streptomyces sp. NBC_01381]MCX4671605.1 alpha/beta hydrolase [Streptomyces sp. NBC_01381]